MRSNLFRSLCTAALLATFASGCSKNAAADADPAAVSAAQAWLSGIDSGDYAGSWQAAAPFFQSVVTEASWKTSLESVRKPMGVLVSRKLKSAETTSQLPKAPAGQYVVMQFETSFANNSATIETVTVGPKQDDQWKASGYYIK